MPDARLPYRLAATRDGGAATLAAVALVADASAAGIPRAWAEGYAAMQHAEAPAWTARHPGLFLGGNAYHGVALNDCTEQAIVLAERIGRFVTLP